MVLGVHIPWQMFVKIEISDGYSFFPFNLLSLKIDSILINLINLFEVLYLIIKAIMIIVFYPINKRNNLISTKCYLTNVF